MEERDTLIVVSIFAISFLLLCALERVDKVGAKKAKYGILPSLEGNAPEAWLLRSVVISSLSISMPLSLLSFIYAQHQGIEIMRYATVVTVISSVCAFAQTLRIITQNENIGTICEAYKASAKKPMRELLGFPIVFSIIAAPINDGRIQEHISQYGSVVAPLFLAAVSYVLTYLAAIWFTYALILLRARKKRRKENK